MPSPGGKVPSKARWMRNGESLTVGKSLVQMLNLKITARIPHQAPPCGGTSFPPVEAMAAAPPNDNLPTCP